MLLLVLEDLLDGLLQLDPFRVREQEELYAIRDELSRPIEVARRAGAARPRLIHRLLAETETRLAADLDRHVAELATLKNAIRRLEAMLDRQYIGLMLYLPDVGDEPYDEGFVRSYGPLHCMPDMYLRVFEAPKVDCWIRVEHLVGDFKRVARRLGFDPSAVQNNEIPHKLTPAYDKDVSHFMNESQLARLYENNPVWALLESILYKRR